mgnify:FL=1
MEETKFIRYLGDTPVTRILDFLITGRDFDYSLSDIARNAGIGWVTLYRIWPKFIANKIAVHTRDIGKAKLFQLNKKNAIVQNLVRLYKSILKSDIKLVGTDKIRLSQE